LIQATKKKAAGTPIVSCEKLFEKFNSAEVQSMKIKCLCYEKNSQYRANANICPAYSLLLCVKGGSLSSVLNLNPCYCSGLAPELEFLDILWFI